jgi:hypothetical protein
MIYYIYRITIGTDIYIGSTRHLKQRKDSHKSNCKSNLNDMSKHKIKLYTTINLNGGWDCCDMALIEEFDCETKRQAECREEFWRREYKATMNTRKCHTTADEKKEYNKEFNKKVNIIKNPLRNLQPSEPCECGGHFKHRNKAVHLRSQNHQNYITKKQNENIKLILCENINSI